MANQVELEFLGDSSDLESTIDSVGSATDTMDRRFRDSGSAIDDTTNRMGRLGDKADGAETSLIGVHDVIDGTATIMQGPGEAGLASYISGWADLAGGLAPLAQQLAVIRIATIRQTAAQLASNAAFLANPIVLIVAAIAILVTAIVLIATKTDWFQRIWKVAWGGIKSAFSSAKNFITDGIDSVVGFISGMGGRIARVASGMFNGIRDAFRGAVNWIIDHWNNFHITLGGQSVKLPFGLGFSIPEFVLKTPNIQRLHTGGVVGGTPGEDVITMLQAGETVNARGSGNATTVDVRFSGSGAFFEAFHNAVRAGEVQLYANGVPVTVNNG